MRHVVLLGLMGSGKTTVGRRLAVRLGREFVDNDELLERRIGTTARAYREEHGFDALHRAEADVLRAALADSRVKVVSAAASVVDTGAVDDVVRRTSTAVWIDVPAAELVRRLTRDPAPHRPLGEDLADELAEQEARRRPRFATLADVVVDGTGAPDEVAAAIERCLAEHGSRVLRDERTG